MVAVVMVCNLCHQRHCSSKTSASMLFYLQLGHIHTKTWSNFYKCVFIKIYLAVSNKLKNSMKVTASKDCQILSLWNIWETWAVNI